MGSLVRIVSGGQTGVDQTALRAAFDCGLECGGWCPGDSKCEGDSPIPAEYHLQPTPHDTSVLRPDIPRSQRTEWNVCCSDATLIFSPKIDDADDSGTRWTGEFADLIHRPHRSFDPRTATVSEITAWLMQIGKERPVKWLNIAGPSRGGLQRQIGAQCNHFLDATRAVMIGVIRELASGSPSVR